MTDGPSSWAHDLAAGCVLAGVGVGAIVVGQSYGIGTLQRMEPGFFPVALGVILIGIGLGLAVSALKLRARQGHATTPLFDVPDWRGWLFIVGGVLSFLVFSTYGGLLPGAFACVFISAMGDRTTTWSRALVLAGCVAVAGSIFFAYVLKVQMPLFTWGPA